MERLCRRALADSTTRVGLLASVVLLGVVQAVMTSPSIASRGYGLEASDILVQEYWEYGEPRYLVANLRSEEMVVDLYTEGATWDDKSLITRWVLPPRAIVVKEPTAAMRSQDIHVHIGKRFLGALMPMAAPPTDGSTIPVLTNSSINYGGGAHEPDLWLEAPTHTLRSGETIQVELHARPPIRRISFGDQVSLVRRMRPELSDDDLERHRSELDFLVVQLADAGAARVVESEDVIDISLPDGLSPESEIVILLAVTAPIVQARALARVHAHREEEYGRGSLTRLFVVEPAPDAVAPSRRIEE